MKQLSILFAFLIHFLCSAQERIKEIFLIPAGFEGKINVIYNQPNSTPILTDSGIRVFNIPNDGILLTSSQDNGGWIEPEYYYMYESGIRIKLAILDKEKDSLSIEPKIVSYGTVGLYGNINNVYERMPYIEFVIASKTTLDSIYSIESETKFINNIKKKTGNKF